MNELLLTGNLVRDAERNETKSGLPRLRFTVAVNRRYKNADGTRPADFLQCTMLGQNVDNILPYMKLGKKVAVIGSVQRTDYTRPDGSHATYYDIFVRSVELLGGAPRSTAAADEEEADAPEGAEAPAMDEIPF